LEEDIEWGDIVFGAGSTVSAGSSLTLTKLFAGRHREISGKDYDLGVGGGIAFRQAGLHCGFEPEID
jgi:hypothetical protein